MYSSAMAPSRHLATVTIRAPLANSPTTHVHSPDPNLIGWDVIWGGVPPPLCSTYDFMASMCSSMPWVLGLSLPVHEYFVGVIVSEHAGPVAVVPSDKVEFIHALKIAINYVVIRHTRRASRAIEYQRLTLNVYPRAVTPPLPAIAGTVGHDPHTGFRTRAATPAAGTCATGYGRLALRTLASACAGNPTSRMSQAGIRRMKGRATTTPDGESEVVALHRAVTDSVDGQGSRAPSRLSL